MAGTATHNDKVMREVNVDEIPDAMRRRNQWVMHRPFQGRPKIPHTVTGALASSTDPTTWTTFDNAHEAYKRGEFDGPGYVFDGEEVGIDIDGCIDDEGRIAPAALAIMEECDSYAEISMSETGVHIIIEGTLPFDGKTTGKIKGCKKLEIYTRGRYFAITGNVVKGCRGDVIKNQPAIDTIVDIYFRADEEEQKPCKGTGAIDLDDAALLAKARSAKNGEKFCALYDRGDVSEYDNDQSRADMALASMLVWWVGDNADRGDRLFRESKLYRDKWDEKRGVCTYGERTLRAAISEHRRNGGFYGAGPKTGDVIEYPDPLRLAEHYAEHKHTCNTILTIRRRDAQWWKFTGAHYKELEEECLTADVYRHLDTVWTPKRDKKGEIEKDENDKEKFVKVRANRSNVNEVLAALTACGTLVIQTPPCWIDDIKRDASDLVPCKNVILNTRTRETYPLTPRFFCPWGLPFAYDVNASTPKRWIEFLHDLWPDDEDSIKTLQELFGLFLTADMRHQKIGLVYGPPRSGKGTIARILIALLGAANVAAPTLAGLASDFGCQPLIGKPLAIISDARLSGRPDQAVIVERLLSISGEDAQTVNRKGIKAVTVKLPTRFLILTNELPRLNDASGAIASRFIMLRLTKSFLGQEDHTLTDDLIAELPGILNWALDGAERLNERGRLLQPSSCAEDIEELKTLGSPIVAFVNECCDMGPKLEVSVKDLYGKWAEWCKSNGRDNPGIPQTFGRDLRAAFPQIKSRQPREGEGRIRVYEGINYV